MESREMKVQIAPLARRLAASTGVLASVVLGLPAPASAAGEVRVVLELAPGGRVLHTEAWARFLLAGVEPPLFQQVPVTSEDRIISELTLVDGRRPVSADLEEVLFPATVYVGRSCPPQEHAELVEVRPSRDGRARKSLAAAEAPRRGGWMGFEPGSADTLTARYFCFPAGYEMVAEDLPPVPGEAPPLPPTVSP